MHRLPVLYYNLTSEFPAAGASVARPGGSCRPRPWRRMVPEEWRASMTIGRPQVILAAMAGGGPGASFFPVQLQKLLFLIDREIPEGVNGPHFRFIPHHYGPFDQEIYIEIKALMRTGAVDVDDEKRHPQYFLTDAGWQAGTHVLQGLSEAAARYVREAAGWVRTLTFPQLLRAIYAYCPAMAVNSVRPSLPADADRSGFWPQPSFLSGLARTVDFMGVLNEYPRDRRARNQDTRNLGGDWARVGANLRNAMAIYAQERLYE